jgi:hypothetical protein
MAEFSRVREGIPRFVREYLNLKDNHQLQWDQGAEGNVGFYRLIKKDYNVTSSIEIPTPPAIEKDEEEIQKKKRDIQVHTA